MTARFYAGIAIIGSLLILCLKGIPRSKKSRLMRRICILAAVTLVVSLVSIIIGIVAVAESGGKFPYNAGGGMIAGIPALLLTFCPFCMFCEAKATSDYGSATTGCFDCCTLLMIVWFSITILAIPVGFGLSGIYGVAACVNEADKAKVCQENADSKLALSVVTIIITGILFILALAIFFTCCCNSSTFGMPILDSYSDTSDRYNTRYDSYTYFSRSNRRETLQELAVQNALSDVRREELRPRPAVISSENVDERAMREPTAPPVGGDRDERPDDDFNIGTGPTPPFRGSSNRYADPPPSYEEVMTKDATESPV